MIYHFSDKEKLEMAQLFENGAKLRELANIFGCSGRPIVRILINFLGVKKYKEIANKHLKEARSKILKKAWKNPTNIMIVSCQENGRKTGPENGRKYGIPAMCKSNAENHTWISKPEKQFYNILTAQNPYLIVKRQYYLKGFNHAYDIAILEAKLLLEVDGDHWHGHSGNKKMDDERIKRDEEVDKFAKSKDWTVIRINDKILKKLGII